jgi:rubrerythrin
MKVSEMGQALPLQQLIDQIVSRPALHAKWLNTLSMLENAGARKIKQCEHPVFVKEEILKHAAEEARHAWYLKKQLHKIGGDCPTYEAAYLLAPIVSSRYLHRIDTSVSRYLKTEYGFTGHDLRYAAYLLVTYAIEVRADELYPIYQEVLKQHKSKISVHNIIAEEQHHLASMEEQLQKLWPEWKSLCEMACREEGRCYREWIGEVERSFAFGHS